MKCVPSDEFGFVLFVTWFCGDVYLRGCNELDSNTLSRYRVGNETDQNILANLIKSVFFLENSYQKLKIHSTVSFSSVLDWFLYCNNRKIRIKSLQFDPSFWLGSFSAQI